MQRFIIMKSVFSSAARRTRQGGALTIGPRR
jgi:hypothetical protein